REQQDEQPAGEEQHCGRTGRRPPGPPHAGRDEPQEHREPLHRSRGVPDAELDRRSAPATDGTTTGGPPPYVAPSRAITSSVTRSGNVGKTVWKRHRSTAASGLATSARCQASADAASASAARARSNGWCRMIRQEKS